MENFEKSGTVFAILSPANDAARDSFSRLAERMLDDEGWNPNARRNIKADRQLAQVSTYSNASESDGGTGPPKKLRPVMKGCYTFDFAEAPRQPDQGWLLGGGKFGGGDDPPDILLTEKKNNDRVSSRHARLAHNFASGSLVITASDKKVVCINGREFIDDQLVIHGRTTSLEFGRLKYILEVRRYDTDADHRNHLKSYQQKHGLGNDDYPSTLLATPADSDVILHDYIMKNPVGDGATSVVYGAVDIRSQEVVAIKKIRRTEDNAKAISCDIATARYIGQHERICHLDKVIDPAAKDPNRGYKMFGLDEVFLVYKPLASWTVQDLINDDITLEPQTRVEIFWQLLEGIEFLHSIGIMHRDIKPLNMTVGALDPAQPNARLIDFGLAKKGLSSQNFGVGTESYMAPEIWAGYEDRSEDAYDESVDIFAFGLSMYQFLCGHRCDWQRIDHDDNGFLNHSTLIRIQQRLLRNVHYPRMFLEMIAAFTFWGPLNRPSARRACILFGRTKSLKSPEERMAERRSGELEEVQDDSSEIGKSIRGLTIAGPSNDSLPPLVSPEQHQSSSA